MLKLTKPKTSKALSQFCAKIADSKLAKEITIMDLESIEGAPADYFVICTCSSDPQIKAVVDAVEKSCIQVGIERPKVEGYGTSQWIILDFFDTVMHIMTREVREYYNLEKLWSDAVFFHLSEKGRLIRA